jgi:hypothetical protein
MQSRRKEDNQALTFCKDSLEIYDVFGTREEGDLKINPWNGLCFSKNDDSVQLRKRE